LSLITVSATNKNVVELPANIMPPSTRERIVDFSTCTAMAEKMKIPVVLPPVPWMSRPRKVTTSVGAAKTKTPTWPSPCTRTPAVPASQEMVIDLVMLSPAKLPGKNGLSELNSPGSRQLISPPGAVLSWATWKVLQGAVRLHVGLL